MWLDCDDSNMASRCADEGKMFNPTYFELGGGKVEKL